MNKSARAGSSRLSFVHIKPCFCRQVEALPRTKFKPPGHNHDPVCASITLPFSYVSKYFLSEPFVNISFADKSKRAVRDMHETGDLERYSTAVGLVQV